MGVTFTRRGPGLPTAPWDLRASRSLGQVVTAAVVTRTFRQGFDINDRPLAPYSRRELWVSRTGRLARRLSPKGGEPSRTGKSVRYRRGYWQYKTESTGKGFVNLTLSGQLLRSVGPLRVTLSRVEVGPRGEPRVYGVALQRRAGRQWIGLSPRDEGIVHRAFTRLLREALERSRGRT